MRQGTHGKAMRHALSQNAPTSDQERWSEDTRLQPRSAERRPATQRLPHERSSTVRDSRDPRAEGQGDPSKRANKQGVQIIGPMDSGLTEQDRAQGRQVVGAPKRDRSATHFRKWQGNRHTGRRGQCRMTGRPPIAHSARPRDDAEVAKRRTPAGGASKGQGRGPNHRWASTRIAAAAAMPAKRRRIGAPPRPVPDARLSGRGWHERWPPPSLCMKDTARCEAP